MAPPTWNIAGRRLATSTAVDYLISDYPELTLRHYDLGGPSPQDAITMADLGRATLFGAFRGWKAAASMHHAAEAAAWPTEDLVWRLDDAPDADLEVWLLRPEVREARSLFASLARGSGGGWREAATSKLLHLKWPEFFPIIDGQLRRLYESHALEFELQLPGSRRSKRPSTTAYWIAVRQDLLRRENVDADAATRDALGSTSAPDKAALLSQLTRLRVLDALAWAIASDALPTSAGTQA